MLVVLTNFRRLRPKANWTAYWQDNMTTIAAIQITAGERWRDHAAKIHGFIKEAADKGAQLITLPENCSGLVSDRAQQLIEAVEEAEHPAVADLSKWAAD